MYKCPIKVLTGEMNIEYENGVLKYVQSLYPSIDKDELTKALQYDREQYNKGYKDGVIETEKRIKEALEIAWDNGTIDGDWHKMWVIDQMVRALCGNEEKYNRWVNEYETPLPDGDYYEWDCGIAP